MVPDEGENEDESKQLALPGSQDLMLLLTPAIQKAQVLRIRVRRVLVLTPLLSLKSTLIPTSAFRGLLFLTWGSSPAPGPLHVLCNLS